MARRLTGSFEARPMAAINLTPLIPVLLAVFAVVAVVAARPTAAVNLAIEPGSVPAPPVPGRTPVPVPFVSIGADGLYTVEGQAVSPGEAPGRLRALAVARGYDTVMIRADGDVPYAKIMDMVQAIHAVGLKAQFINEDLH